MAKSSSDFLFSWQMLTILNILGKKAMLFLVNVFSWIVFLFLSHYPNSPLIAHKVASRIALYARPISCYQAAESKNFARFKFYDSTD